MSSIGGASCNFDFDVPLSRCVDERLGSLHEYMTIGGGGVCMVCVVGGRAGDGGGVVVVCFFCFVFAHRCEVLVSCVVVLVVCTCMICRCFG